MPPHKNQTRGEGAGAFKAVRAHLVGRADAWPQHDPPVVVVYRGHQHVQVIAPAVAASSQITFVPLTVLARGKCKTSKHVECFILATVTTVATIAIVVIVATGEQSSSEPLHT